MNTSRLVIVPSETMEPIALPLRAQLASLAGTLDAGNIVEAMGRQAIALIERLHDAVSNGEVIVWARSEPSFLAAWTSREPETEVVHSASSDAMQGLVSEVFESRRTKVRAEPELRAGDWTNLEQRRGFAIAQMAASPLVVFERCVAVITTIHYRSVQPAVHLSGGEASELAVTAGVVSRLIEDRLIRALLGLEPL
jgi:hypothetical protein